MLGLGTAAQTAASALMFGLPFLLPWLRRADGLSLAQAGALAAAPSVGLVLTLIAWGALADRFGERAVLTIGLLLTGGIALASVAAREPAARGVMFALIGATGASVNAASGRLVMGWFGAHQRGVAMGVRQMGQPLGVAAAALVMPPARRAPRRRARPGRTGSRLPGGGAHDRAAGPRPRDGAHHRRPVGGTAGVAVPSPAHAVARARGQPLLVVPQFATATFAAEYLVSGRGWDGSDAGRVLAVVALAGALGRLGAGRWSDVVGSRLRPMRQVAVLSAACMALLGLAAHTGSWLVLVALALASVVSVSDNGLGFTATAELAGRGWSGRALGVQNTAQNLAAFATGPLIGALAGLRGFAVAFGACAVFPLLGAWATPVRDEHRADSPDGVRVSRE